MADYDVLVIGGGPGGYVAAIRCAQLGLKTACVDAWRNARGEAALGGTCLNVGCIPSKALLDSSHQYHKLQHELAAHGIRVKGAELDVKTMQQRKEQVVKTLTGGIATLFTKHKVQWIKGHARLLGPQRVEVIGHEKNAQPQPIGATHIIIATGSSPAHPEIAEVDGERIVDSTGALAFDAVPKRLGVVGGGVIGLELGSVWSRLGAKTTVLVRGERFLPNVEPQIAKAAFEALSAQGLDIRLGAKLQEVKKTAKQISVGYQQGDKSQRLQVDRLLMATGRRPNTEALNAEAAGLRLDQRGFIEVDELCRTNLPNVYAIGDVVRGPMLAHKASEEGIAVAERIAGQHGEVNYSTIPWVIYTWPEIAWVGKTSTQLEQEGTAFRAGAFPFIGNGRAHGMGDTQGLVKVLSDAQSDRILGVHIFGPGASEMIAEAVLAMEFSASAEDLARTVHAHPTLSEALHEAALAAGGRAIHI